MRFLLMIFTFSLLSWPVAAGVPDRSCIAALVSAGTAKMELRNLGSFYDIPENLERLQKYYGQNLVELQNRSLKKSLIAHGASSRRQSGRSVLEKLSAENRVRWDGADLYVHSEGMEKVERLIANLDFAFIHNSHHFVRKGKIPILSSHQLEILGLGGGMNTSWFNKRVISSDDNVFFFVLPVIQDITRLPMRGLYGKGFRIDDEYAEQTGWISPYIMYPRQLLDAIAILDDPLAAKIRKKDSGNYFLYGGHFELGSPLGRLVQEGVKQLFLNDFTVRDFRDMTRNRMLLSLAKLKDQSPKEFENATEALRSPKIEALQWAVSEFAYKPMGFGFDNGKLFEFKIPVAVPQEQMSRLR